MHCIHGYLFLHSPVHPTLSRPRDYTSARRQGDCSNVEHLRQTSKLRVLASKHILPCRHTKFIVQQSQQQTWSTQTQQKHIKLNTYPYRLLPYLYALQHKTNKKKTKCDEKQHNHACNRYENPFFLYRESPDTCPLPTPTIFSF